MKVCETEVTHRGNQLKNIFRQSSELSCMLAKQNVRLQTLFLRDLCREAAYSTESSLLIPHPSMHLEENDTTLNGMLIDLVVHPAIIAWGDEHGENYDQYKVWQSAVVYITRGKEPRDSKEQKAAVPSESLNAARKRSCGDSGVDATKRTKI